MYVGSNLTFDLHKKPDDTYSPISLYRHHGVSIYDNSKQEECSHLMLASLVHIVKVFIECYCTEKLWYCQKKLFLFHVLDFNATFANQDPLSTLKPGNFDLHTKIPGSAPV